MQSHAYAYKCDTDLGPSALMGFSIPLLHICNLSYNSLCDYDIHNASCTDEKGATRFLCFLNLHYKSMNAWNVFKFLCHFCISNVPSLLHHYNDVIMSAMVSQINGVSIVYSNVCSGADQRKHQSSSASMALWGEFTVDQWKGPVTRKMFPFDDVITMLKLWGNTLWCISLSLSIYICMCVCICAYSESQINARKNTQKTPDMKCLVSLAPKVQHSAWKRRF